MYDVVFGTKIAVGLCHLQMSEEQGIKEIL